jgi:hypothetical protein
MTYRKVTVYSRTTSRGPRNQSAAPDLESALSFRAAMNFRVPTNRVARFPLRRVASILIVRERDSRGWLALAGPHGWLCGSLEDARADAQWLSKNLGLPVRELGA